MATKSGKKKSFNISQEIQRLGVLMEHIDGKVSLVAEQRGDIQKDIGGIKRTEETHTEMIGKVMVDIEIIKEDIEFIKGGLKRKIDTEEFTALERRVALLEKRR